MMNNAMPVLANPPVPTAATTTTTNLKEDPMELELAGIVREIGTDAVWSVSSCKPGFGVEQLRDNCLDTYWQSDGPQPHLVNVQFHK
jgi:anaphase-promoting complex subunit 10